jgi:hypothetical protein
MQKARLIKANEPQPERPEPPKPRVSRTGQLKRVVTEWVNERREPKQSARQAFAALFAEG